MVHTIFSRKTKMNLNIEVLPLPPDGVAAHRAFIFQSPLHSMMLVKENGLYLQHVVDKTPEICLAAVKQNWLALGYVDAEYRTSSEIISAALRNNPKAKQYATIHIRFNEEF